MSDKELTIIANAITNLNKRLRKIEKTLKNDKYKYIKKNDLNDYLKDEEEKHKSEKNIDPADIIPNGEFNRLYDMICERRRNQNIQPAICKS